MTTTTHIVKNKTMWFVALIAGMALVLAPAAAAHAANGVNIDYDASGTTHIAGTNSNIDLGPSTLHTSIDTANGDLTGSLDLPGTTTKFKLIGFLPVTADVNFEPAAPLEGHITLTGSNAIITSTAKYYVRLSNIKVAGIPTFAGSHCRTINPVSIPANTPEGEGFDILQGGTLQGTYTIGAFHHCGLNTLLINAVVPGSGNTLTLHATNGHTAN